MPKRDEFMARTTPGAALIFGVFSTLAIWSPLGCITPRAAKHEPPHSSVSSTEIAQRLTIKLADELAASELALNEVGDARARLAAGTEDPVEVYRDLRSTAIRAESEWNRQQATLAEENQLTVGEASPGMLNETILMYSAMAALEALSNESPSLAVEVATWMAETQAVSQEGQDGTITEEMYNTKIRGRVKIAEAILVEAIEAGGPATIAPILDKLQAKIVERRKKEQESRASAKRKRAVLSQIRFVEIIGDGLEYPPAHDLSQR